MVLAVSTGCSGRYFGPVPGQEAARPHVVQVGWDGNFYEIPDQIPDSQGGPPADQPINSMSGYERTSNCGPKAESFGGECQMVEQKRIQRDAFDTITNRIDGYSEIDSEGYKHVLIYIHGGLNMRSTSFKRVVKQMTPILTTGKYPVFINWRSGAVTCLKDHYFRIRDGEISPEAPGTSPVYIVGDLFKVIGNAPMAWWKEGQTSFKSTAGRNDSFVPKDAGKYENVLFQGDDEKFQKTYRSLWWILTSPLKLVVTPFTFTLGKPAWDNMKRRVHTQFIRPGDLSHAEVPALVPTEELTPGGEGATLAFLRHLNEHIVSNNQKIRLTLVGHSMGGIIVNRILTHFPELPVENIVYMASADNLQNFIDATVPFVYKGQNNPTGRAVRVYSLHLHPENEDREVSAVGAAPSGSLLVWIDHSYEEPEYTLQRTAGRWYNMRQVFNLIPSDIRTAYRFKVFGRSERPCFSPQKHGAFDDSFFPFWDESFWWRGADHYCQE